MVGAGEPGMRIMAVLFPCFVFSLRGLLGAAICGIFSDLAATAYAVENSRGVSLGGGGHGFAAE